MTSHYRSALLKALLKDKMFVTGLVFLAVVVSMAVAGYVVVPEDARTNWYLNPRWELNPKLVPPCWANYVYQVRRVPSTNVTSSLVREYWEVLAEKVWSSRYAELLAIGVSDEEVLKRLKDDLYARVRSEYEGRGLSFSYDYQFYGDVPPVDIALILTSSERDIEVDVAVALRRPDGETLEFSVGERISVRKDSETIVKLSHSRDFVSKLVSFIVATHDIATASASKNLIEYGLRSPVEMFSYGSVGQGGVVQPSDPIEGLYAVRVDVTSGVTLRGGDIGVKLRIIGSCHGILGTDNMGRDNLWTLLAGSVIALMIGLPYALISRMVGLVYGATSGFFGGTVVDLIMQRVCEIVYAMPYLPFIIMISYTLKETTGASVGIPQIVGLLVVFGWTGVAIVSRSMALSIREEPYVEFAKAIGVSKAGIIYRYIIPQLMPYFFASVMLATPGAILTEVFLSVLGLTDPNMPSWGKMVSGAQLTVHAWWWIVPPGVAITITGLTFMFMGYAIENATNPRRRTL